MRGGEGKRERQRRQRQTEERDKETERQRETDPGKWAQSLELRILSKKLTVSFV